MKRIEKFAIKQIADDLQTQARTFMEASERAKARHAEDPQDEGSFREYLRYRGMAEGYQASIGKLDALLAVVEVE